MGSGESGTGNERFSAEIWAGRDAYKAGRDIAITNNYVIAAETTARFKTGVVRAAEELAAAVAEQWRREERLRRLQDPVPIPVRWSAADPLLSDHVANIRRAPDHSLELAGSLDKAVETFLAIQSRRLVVIGEPGAGKTVFALRITLDLLARRQPGDPVPVILGLHTWNPIEQSLQDWMAQRLAADYPALQIADKSGPTIASELVRRQLIIPVLDGLDEVIQSLRGDVLRALNISMDRDAPVIVTCRDADYRQIVADADVLTSAAVIKLLPIEVADLADYLPRTTKKVSSRTGPGFTTKWDGVLERLRSEPDDPACQTLLEVLRTPLMTSLARTVYSDTTADPAVLLDGSLTGRDEVEAHLLDAFIPAAFNIRRPGRSARDAEAWLGFLATHLNRFRTQDLEWWRLEAAIPAPAHWLTSGVIAWVSIGAIFGTIHGTPWAWLYGAFGAAGLTVGLASATAEVPQPMPGHAARRRLMLRRLLYVGLAGGTVGVLTGSTGMVANAFNPGGVAQDQLFSIGYALLAGFSVGVVLGIAGIDVQRTPTTTPVRLPRRSRRFSRPRSHRVWRPVLSSIVIGAGLGLAWALGFGGAQAARIETAPGFPPGGSAIVHRNGGSYVDYPDGLRYSISSIGDRSIVTTRRIPFYTGDAYGNFYSTEADCQSVDTDCYIQPPHMFKFYARNEPGMFGPAQVYAVVLDGPDPLSPYYVDPGPATGVDAQVTNWLAAPQLSSVFNDIYPLVILVLVLVVLVSSIGGLLRWLALPSDIAEAISPAPTLRADRSAAIFRGTAVSLLILVAVIILLKATGAAVEIRVTLASARITACCVAMGLLAITLSTWLRFQAARTWLAARGRLPWRLMGFLNAAHTRGVLRQAGAAYQFRHVRLQERLAARATAEQDLRP